MKYIKIGFSYPCDTVLDIVNRVYPNDILRCQILFFRHMNSSANPDCPGQSGLASRYLYLFFGWRTSLVIAHKHTHTYVYVYIYKYAYTYAYILVIFAFFGRDEIEMTMETNAQMTAPQADGVE